MNEVISDGDDDLKGSKAVTENEKQRREQRTLGERAYDAYAMYASECMYVCM